MRLSNASGRSVEARGLGMAVGVVLAMSLGGCGGGTPTAGNAPTASSAPTTVPCLGVNTSGAMADPAGDVPETSVSSPVPDLIDARAAIADCRLTMTLTFAPGTFSRMVTHWQIGLDTDENPASGFSGRNSAHDDAHLMGADYLITSSPDVDRGAVRQYVAGSGFTTLGSVPLVIEGDRLSFVVPLSMLGSDDGRLVFEVSAAIRIGSTTSTPILDYLPDLHAALPRTR